MFVWMEPQSALFQVCPGQAFSAPHLLCLLWVWRRQRNTQTHVEAAHIKQPQLKRRDQCRDLMFVQPADWIRSLTPRSAWDHGEPWSSSASPDLLSACCPDRWRGPETRRRQTSGFFFHTTKENRVEHKCSCTTRVNTEPDKNYRQVSLCHFEMWPI